MNTRVVKIDSHHPDAQAIAEAADVLKRGGIVAFPTETVYGLGANALDTAAVSRIFEAKGRPPTDPLIVHIAHAAELPSVARDIPPQAHRLAERFWPGALTLILPKQETVPDLVTAGLPTVGVRVPGHKVALALLRTARLPIAAPSANQFSRPSPTRAEHVIADLGGAIDLVLDGGQTSIGVESTILDLTSTPPRVLRPGGVAVESIRHVLPDVVIAAARGAPEMPQLAPGQLLKHYAPRAQLTLYLGSPAHVIERLSADARSRLAAGVRIGLLALEEDLKAVAPRLAAVGASGRLITARYGSRKHRDEAARMLFTAMRELDADGVDEILASAPGPDDIGRAVIDRLTRAADGRVVRCGEGEDAKH
jgi:L-threonylcarbamoyladenylate synthase